jgi:hypothetical protein
MIKIKESKTADTRTCDVTKVTKEILEGSSKQHISDVKKGMHFFAGMLKMAAARHDYTKITDIDQFYADFKTSFNETSWWEMHQEKERHHLSDSKYVQSDVNLLDILEMITDGVMAGMARSGEYRKEEVSDELLRKAFDNTIDLLLSNVILETSHKER